MRFYLKTWFIILLLIAATGLFFSIVFLSEISTQLEFLSAENIISQGQFKDQGSLPLGFSQEAPSRGNPQAKIKIVEFSDFQCSFCREVFFVLQEVFAEYKDDIYFQYRHFPMSQNSRLTAQASMCAKDQGKFWEYYDLLFRSQTTLDVNSLKNVATIIDLDNQEFESCLDNQKYVKVVQRDSNDGLNLGVAATPTFFINGRKIQGVLPFDVWEKIISSKIVAL